MSFEAYTSPGQLAKQALSASSTISRRPSFSTGTFSSSAQPVGVPEGDPSALAPGPEAGG